jgi:hypothetical protein
MHFGDIHNYHSFGDNVNETRIPADSEMMIV